MTTTTATPTPASLYQQFKRHLTELKLADALPSILDRTQAEDWPLTHALEQLPAIEVSATE